MRPMSSRERAVWQHLIASTRLSSAAKTSAETSWTVAFAERAASASQS